MGTYMTLLTVDDKGRIVIPLRVRELMGLQKGDVLQLAFTTNDGIISVFALDGAEKEK